MTTLDPLKNFFLFFFFNALDFLNILPLSLWKYVKNWSFGEFSRIRPLPFSISSPREEDPKSAAPIEEEPKSAVSAPNIWIAQFVINIYRLILGHLAII